MLATILFVLAATGIAIYVLLLLAAWRWQERLVFQPPRWRAAGAVDAHRIEYEATDGTRLHAFVVGEARTDSPVLLAFHGNADLARWLLPWAADVVRETGACVVLPEYRGYDGVAGAPTCAGAALDARAALAFVERGTAGQDRAPHHAISRNVVLFGHSLGSAVATELAHETAAGALVLQSPFTSARAMAARMLLPGMTALWRLITRVHYDTVARVADLPCPVFVAHGARDRVVPVEMGRAVFAAARSKGRLLVVPEAGHNDVAEVGDGAYWEWLRAALASGATDARGEMPPAPSPTR